MLFMICFQKPHTGEYSFLWYLFRMRLRGLILHGKCLWHVEGVEKSQMSLEICSSCFMEQIAVVHVQILHFPTFLFLLSLLLLSLTSPFEVAFALRTPVGKIIPKIIEN